MEGDDKTSRSDEEKLPESSGRLDEQKKAAESNETELPESSIRLNEESKAAESSASSSGFVNHGAIIWEEDRRKWIGDPSKRPQRIKRDLTISWDTGYEDLLTTSAPFPNPIPLTEMVDYLDDFWLQEQLSD